jgi:hypothetical protein
MRLPFAVAAVVAAVGLTGFMVAGVSRAPAGGDDGARAELTGAQVEPERLSDTTRLRRGLDAMPRTLATRRNPFRFAADRRDPAPRPLARVAADEGGEGAWPEPARPQRPGLQVLGIDEGVEPGGTVVRTAVIGAMNQVFLVKEGEQVMLRFLVRRIGRDGVAVEDLADDTVMTLPLR